MKLVALLTTTFEIGLSSEAMVELAWSWPRSMFSATACASSGVPSVKVRPGRNVKVTLSPLLANDHDEARPGPTLPLGRTVVMVAYTRLRTWLSQPGAGGDRVPRGWELPLPVQGAAGSVGACWSGRAEMAG